MTFMGARSENLFSVQVCMCMNICTWVCMTCGKVAVCMGTFNLVTEDVALSQEEDAPHASEVVYDVFWP